MTKEMLDQMQDFEIFVEKMEIFVEEIKSDETFKKEGFKLEDMDLRTKDGEIFPIPTKLEDYFDLWKEVKICANDYYSEPSLEKREIFGLNEFFFDLYWNDVTGNAAHFQDMVFWVYFHDTKGICYSYSDMVIEDAVKMINAEGETGRTNAEHYIIVHDKIVFEGNDGTFYEVAQFVCFGNEFKIYAIDENDNGVFFDFDLIEKDAQRKIIENLVIKMYY